MHLPSLRRSLPWILVLAVALRLGLLGWNLAAHPELLYPRPEPPEPQPPVEAGAAPTAVDVLREAPADRRPHLSAFGFEASNVAAALVCHGRGLADPFGVPSGPTGWVSPGVVVLYAVPFRVFGCFSPGSVVTVYGVGIVLSAALVVLAAATARRLWRDPAVPLLAALLAALSPFDLRLFTSASTLELNLHAFLLLLLVYLLLGLGRGPTLPRLTGVAGVAAVATLFNPVFVAVAAGGLPVALWQAPALPRGRRFPGLLPGLALLVAAQAVLVGPYLLYQRTQLGTWVFVKSNAPFEIALGNRPGAGGVLRHQDFRQGHPSQDPEELARYLRQREVAYVLGHGRRFLEQTGPDRLARATLHRGAEYFFGVGYARKALERVGRSGDDGDQEAAAVARPVVREPRSPERRLPMREVLLTTAYCLVGVVFLLFPLVAHRLPVSTGAGRAREGDRWSAQARTATGGSGAGGRAPGGGDADRSDAADRGNRRARQLPGPFRLRPGEGVIYAAALLYAAPHLVAAVMPRYVLPVTPLALLLGAAVAAVVIRARSPGHGAGSPPR